MLVCQFDKCDNDAVESTQVTHGSGTKLTVMVCQAHKKLLDMGAPMYLSFTKAA